LIQDRDSGRVFFLEVWGKNKKKLPLEALEQMVLDVILQHPEYHVILENDDKEISATGVYARNGPDKSVSTYGHAHCYFGADWL